MTTRINLGYTVTCAEALALAVRWDRAHPQWAPRPRKPEVK